MLVILTRPPKLIFKNSSIYFGKFFLKKILGKSRGPDAVLESLIRGLNKNNTPFKLNSRPSPEDTIHVISNIEALRWAIAQKKLGKIKKLIAGPNLVVVPTDYEKILDNEALDKILVPSEWVRKFYALHLSKNKEKIIVWPSGVEVPNENQLGDKKSDDKKCLVYIKHAPEALATSVLDHLKNKCVDFSIINYGNYSKQKYQEELTKSTYMIYLQKAESQGLALQEAWAMNIPTLVWDCGYWELGTNKIEYEKISCPYLNDESGMTFAGKEDFGLKLNSFLERLNSFEPRKYVLRELSDEVSARKYSAII
jgi:hypothetical protein